MPRVLGHMSHMVPCPDTKYLSADEIPVCTCVHAMCVYLYVRVIVQARVITVMSTKSAMTLLTRGCVIVWVGMCNVLRGLLWSFVSVGVL
jgi:hypothetical protein